MGLNQKSIIESWLENTLVLENQTSLTNEEGKK